MHIYGLRGVQTHRLLEAACPDFPTGLRKEIYYYVLEFFWLAFLIFWPFSTFGYDSLLLKHLVSTI